MPEALSASAGVPAPTTGFYGKLPMRGDFLSARLPQSFIAPWDDWLQRAIATSRELLGEAWLPAYLSAPIWRFLLAGGVCGRHAVIGVLMPSVDKVGRYFPLAVAAALPVEGAPFALLGVAGAWFEAVERLALSALDEGADFAAFEREAEAIAAPPVPAEPGVVFHAGAAPAARLAGPCAIAGAAPALLDVLPLLLGCWSLWWTGESDDAVSSLIVAAGLPPADGFAAFLDGQWERWGWATR
jgi:type VI secretion system protein ImpM